MVKRIKLLLIVIGIWSLGSGISAHADVTIYLSPSKDANIVNDVVTYDITLEADVDTKLEAVGDIFLAYDKTYLILITPNVVDLITSNIRWTDTLLQWDQTRASLVSENWGLVRFAKISLGERMLLPANKPIKILRVPFRIDPKHKFRVTKLYFPQALAIDDQHKNVLRKVSESFLIRKYQPKKKTKIRRKQK